MWNGCGVEEVSRVHMASLNKMGCYSNSGSSFCQMKGPAASHQSSPHSKILFHFFPSTLNSPRSCEEEKECLIHYTWPTGAQQNGMWGGGMRFVWLRAHLYARAVLTILRPSQMIAVIKREEKQIEHERVSDISWLLLKRFPKKFINRPTASWTLSLLISQPHFSWFAQTRANLPKQKTKTVMLTSVPVASEGELESLLYFRGSTFNLIFREFSPPASLQQNPGDKGYSFKMGILINKWVFSVKSQ